MGFFKFENGTAHVGEETFDELYFEGGYGSIPDGCKDWGSSEEEEIRFFGDRMGDIEIVYSDNEREIYPLVLGYTIWYKNMWERDCAPFKGKNANEKLVSALKDALYLYGAFEGSEKCVLKITPKQKPISDIFLRKAENKSGEPVFSGFYTNLPDGCGEEFFKSRSVMPGAVPEHVAKSLDTICRALFTYEEDFKGVPEYVLPESGAYIKFSGDDEARIATGVFAENMKDLSERVDSEGFFHTSYLHAPSWWYNGFGTWMEDFSSYYNDYYSRDAGRALLTLSAAGFADAAERGAAFGNKQLMYFPENRIKFHGHDVRGHYTVIINKPMFYSEILSYSGWPTQYTEERFGADHKNLGNHETDGHGLMMMANYNIYRRSDDPQSWVEKHFAELTEAAEWIVWCLDTPELSLSENGLLYAESEAGMNAHTLYCNLACYLGLSGYAEIATATRRKELGEKWQRYADGLYGAIISGLSENGRWRPDKYGFFHDPSVTFCSDIYGFDTSFMPDGIERLSAASYENDAEKTLSLKYDGSGGLGYNTSMITQNALLLDRTADADRLVRRLTRMCYAPRLPEPYRAPEGFSYSERLGALRRQGDLGNLVQLAEALKTYQIVCGVSDAVPGVLQIYPRLPEKWNAEMHGVDFAHGKLWLSVAYPENGIQEMKIRVSGMKGVGKISFRAGPFVADGGKLVINGRIYEGAAVRSGDAYWIRVDAPYSEFEIN